MADRIVKFRFPGLPFPHTEEVRHEEVRGGIHRYFITLSPGKTHLSGADIVSGVRGTTDKDGHFHGDRERLVIGRYSEDGTFQTFPVQAAQEVALIRKRRGEKTS